MSSVYLLLTVLMASPFTDGDEVSYLRPTELLEDIEHPDRWRWIPDQKIPEGNLLERVLVTSFISPFVFFEGDVGTGGGFAINDIDFRNQRRSQLANIWATYTTEGQERFSISWKEWLAHRDHSEKGVLIGDRDFIGLTVSHSRTLTSRFFGLGSDTQLADEGSYTRETNSIGCGIQRSIPEIGGDWVWHADIYLQKDDLGSGKVSNALDVKDQYPDLFNDGNNYEALWIRAGIRHDTRDAQHLPYRGHSLGFSIAAIPWVDDHDTGAIASVTGNWTTPITPLFHDGGNPAQEHPPTDSIGAYLSLSNAIGDVPFWALPTLGGDSTLRGTIRGRWRDRCAWATGVEWRPWILPNGFPVTDKIRIERIGFALFADAGAVADDLSEIPDATVHSTAGIGLRFTFERQALFRIDFGRSDEGDTNLSISYGLPF